MFPEIDRAHIRIGEDLLGCPLGQHGALVDDVGPAADAKGLADIVVGDQDADIAFGELRDDALDVDHRDRVDPGERLVEEYEFRLNGQCARDLQAPTLCAIGFS